MEQKKCEPIINGFTCNISLNQLNEIKQQNNLNFKKTQSPTRTRVELFDNQGNTVATAVKYQGNSNDNIQMVSKKNLL